MNKIDIHCHTTNRTLNHVVPKSCSIDAIAKEMKKHEIDTTVLLATYFPHRGTGISNFRLLHWIQEKERGIISHENFHMFGSLDFDLYFRQGMNELFELTEKKLIKGIKIYTGYQHIDLKSEKFKQVLKLAQDYSLPLMFHTGYSYSSMRNYGKPAITDFVKASDLEFIPDKYGVKIIISHLAKPFLTDLIGVINRQSLAYTDSSGLFDSKYEKEDIPQAIEDVTRVLGECGPKKLLFGTDFPVQTHEDSIYVVEEAMRDFHPLDKKEVYYYNASRLLYKLEL